PQSSGGSLGRRSHPRNASAQQAAAIRGTVIRRAGAGPHGGAIYMPPPMRRASSTCSASSDSTACAELLHNQQPGRRLDQDGGCFLVDRRALIPFILLTSRQIVVRPQPCFRTRIKANLDSISPPRKRTSTRRPWGPVKWPDHIFRYPA